MKLSKETKDDLKLFAWSFPVLFIWATITSFLGVTHYISYPVSFMIGACYEPVGNFVKSIYNYFVNLHD